MKTPFYILCALMGIGGFILFLFGTIASNNFAMVLGIIIETIMVILPNWVET